ncbi:MAG TPA: tetratricopeptide repeat protein [Emcibacteraceae bacterium]|nr:tetratricopeptide repeat protein [Emcibacteraceae bacterium]
MLSWLILQMVGVLTPILMLPSLFGRIVFMSLIVIFPITMVITWAFELTPEGIKKTSTVSEEESILHTSGQKLNYAIIAFLILVIGFQLWLGSDSDKNSVMEQSVHTDQSIAVLPFVNMSSDIEQEYFSDGLSEELLNVLGKFSGLKVAGRTSSFAYKGKNEDLRTIGQDLKVSYILEGSVRKQKATVRITAQLIRASDGFNEWSETYDRELSDIFLVQEEIANAIAENMAISMELTPTQNLISTKTKNMDAYDAYLEGKMLISKRSSESINKAIKILNEAVEKEENYAPLWGTLAQAYTLSYYYSGDDNAADGIYLGEKAARKALEIDPKSSSAHGALGDILKDQLQWELAENQYILALEYDPKNVEVLEQYGQLLLRAGKLKKAVNFLSKARELDPLGPNYNAVEGMARSDLGEKERGFELLDISINLSNNASHYIEGSRIIQGLESDTTENSQRLFSLILEHNNPVENEFFNSDLTKLLADNEKLEQFLKTVLTQIKEEPQTLNKENPFAGIIYAGLAAKLQNYDLAFSFLEIEEQNSLNYKNHDVLLYYWAKIFVPMRNMPRMKQLYINYGLVDYWRRTTFPYFCREDGENDFTCN